MLCSAVNIFFRESADGHMPGVGKSLEMLVYSFKTNIWNSGYILEFGK